MLKTENVPALKANVEGLRRHHLASGIIVGNVTVSEPVIDRKLRAWLLHTITSAVRHYTRARLLIEKQERDGSQGGITIFYTFEVSEHLEDCVMSVHRICLALKKMKDSDTACKFAASHKGAIATLASIRNQFEHMHTQVVSSETGAGPVSIVYEDEGRIIQFRKLKMQTSQLHLLIEDAFRVVAGFYPDFDVSSPAEKEGPLRMGIYQVINTTFFQSGDL